MLFQFLLVARVEKVFREEGEMKDLLAIDLDTSCDDDLIEDDEVEGQERDGGNHEVILNLKYNHYKSFLKANLLLRIL